ncbi:MAG: hypothetical protein ACYC27_13025 [Armatimonadota bacterium]
MPDIEKKSNNAMKSVLNTVTEITAAVWLVIVIVQYLVSSFFPMPEIDFKIAYIIMLCLTPVIAGAHIIASSKSSKDQTE